MDDCVLIWVCAVCTCVLFVLVFISEDISENTMKSEKPSDMPRLMDVNGIGRVWVLYNRPLCCAMCGNSVRPTQRPVKRKGLWTHEGCIAPGWSDPTRGGRRANTMKIPQVMF